MYKVDIVIPVYYNNVDEIESCVKEQVRFYKDHLNSYEWKIIIGINGLNKKKIIEKTKEICNKYKLVDYDHTDEAGRGVSLNRLFTNSDADFVIYMDVDLATELEAIPKMLKELENYDVVVGSKYIDGASHHRTPIRFLLSKTYNSMITKLLLNANFTDAQCGFKGMNVKAAKKILPLVEDRGWFWDTEMLYIIQKKGFSFKEIPVNWTERGNSGVKLLGTVKDFIIKTIRLRYRNV